MEAAEVELVELVADEIPVIADVTSHAEAIVEAAPIAPKPAFTAEVVVRCGDVENRSAIDLRSDEAEAGRGEYGRKPAPYCPPIGMPMIMFPMTSMTVLFPKSFLVPKKLGLYPNVASPPIAPPPIHPAPTPNEPRPSPMSLPKFTPAQGFTKPSA